MVVKSGDLRWTVRDRTGRQFETRVSLGESSALELNAPGRGTLNIAGRNAVWRSAAGTSVEQSVPSGFLASELRQGISPDFTNVAQRLIRIANGNMRKELGWLAELNADVTVLVIPGISAFGIKTPPLNLGSVILPAMNGDISLRTVAIDLSGGHLAFALRIHRAVALDNGILKIGLQGANVDVTSPSFRLSADVDCSLGDRSATVILDWMEFESNEIKGSLSRKTDNALAFTAAKVDGSCHDIVSEIDLQNDTVKVVSGTIALSTDTMNLQVDNAVVGPLKAKSIAATATRGVKTSLTVEHSQYRGSIRVETLNVTATEPEVQGLPIDGTAELDPTVPIEFEGRGIEFALPEFEMKAGVVDLDVTLKKATIKLSGLNIDVPDPFKIRAEVGCSGPDRREGVLLDVPHAILTSPHFSGAITLLDSSAKRWTEKPADLLAPSKFILQSRSINELSILVELDTRTILPGKQVDVAPQDLDLNLRFITFLLQKVTGQASTFKRPSIR